MITAVATSYYLCGILVPPLDLHCLPDISYFILYSRHCLSFILHVPYFFSHFIHSLSYLVRHTFLILSFILHIHFPFSHTVLTLSPTHSLSYLSHTPYLISFTSLMSHISRIFSPTHSLSYLLHIPYLISHTFLNLKSTGCLS